MERVMVRAACPADAASILAVYAPYVKETAITFEYDVPGLEEFTLRIQDVLKKHPYLVALIGERIVGFAYVSGFHDRRAYDWSVETSIYVDREYTRQGIGRRLHEALEAVLKEMGILNMNACIASPVIEDATLTRNSIDFHAHMGYRFVGEFYECGYKFERWYNMVWMEKHIGLHKTGVSSPLLFDEVREVILRKYGIG